MGEVACRKVGGLLGTGAEIVVVAGRADERLQVLAAKQLIELHLCDFSLDFLEGCWLVIAATDNNEVNREVFEQSQLRRILCNVVDVPELCTFHVPAIVRRGPLQIAISTAGKCPAMSRAIKKELSSQFGPSIVERIQLLEAIRLRVKELFPNDISQRMKINKAIVADAKLDFLSIDDSQAIDELINSYAVS